MLCVCVCLRLLPKEEEEKIIRKALFFPSPNRFQTDALLQHSELLEQPPLESHFFFFFSPQLSLIPPFLHLIGLRCTASLFSFTRTTKTTKKSNCQKPFFCCVFIYFQVSLRCVKITTGSTPPPFFQYNQTLF